MKYRGFGLFYAQNSSKKAVKSVFEVHMAKVIVYKVPLIVYRVWVIVYIAPHIVAEYKSKGVRSMGKSVRSIKITTHDNL